MFHSLLQAQQPAPQGSIVTQLLFFGLIFLVFYFLILRPQTQRQKKEKNFREGLKKGDKVITAAGIYGRVLSIENTEVLLEVDDNVKLRLERAAIRGYQPNFQPQA